MKKIKYLIIVVIVLCLSISLYKNYIYYKIPHNPFDDVDTEIPLKFYFEANNSVDDETKISGDLETSIIAFKYFKNLELLPIKSDETPEYHQDTYFSGRFKFSESFEEDIIISDIYLENLTVLYVSSDRPGFKDGYYKIINGKFDYEYINDLMDNKE